MNRKLITTYSTNENDFKTSPLPKLSGLVSKFTNRNAQNKINSETIKALEQLSSSVSSDFSVVNLIEVLKNVVIDKFGYVFFGLYLIQQRQESYEYFSVDNKNNSYIDTIPFGALDKTIENVFKQGRKEIIKKNFGKIFAFEEKLPYKKAICFPVYVSGSIQAVLCVGSKDNTVNDTLINLIAQQIGLLLINNTLTYRLKKQANLVNQDSLTGLMTFEIFLQRLELEISRSQRSKTSFCLMYIDIYDVNLIISKLSNAIGDDVIKAVSGIIRDNTRGLGTCARVEDTRFAVLLPNTDIKYALMIAKMLMGNIHKADIPNIQSIGVSFGLATYPNICEDKDEFMEWAEKASDLAKKDGVTHKKSIIINAHDLKQPQKLIIEPSAGSANKPDEHTFTQELINQLHFVQPNSQSSAVILEIITSLAAAIDAKDSYTKGHSQVVSKYSEMLCNQIGLTTERTECIRIGALMHDVGKIGIPEKVLTKPAKLDSHEWDIMKQHPVIGARKIIQPISLLNEMIPIIEHHHERWDGLGYPYGLRGTETPLGARIVSIADAFHTMTTDRPYRKALGYEKAVAILKEGAGVQWDADLVRAFLAMAPQLKEITKIPSP